MSAADRFLSLGGVEVTNTARLATYAATIAPPSMTISVGSCDGLATVIKCLTGDPTPVYTTPEADDAPWWDPHPNIAPLARRFAGWAVSNITGIDDATEVGEVAELVSGGGVHLRPQIKPRKIELELIGWGSDCCSAHYGLTWLRRALRSACGVNGVDMEYLVACPPEGTCTSGSYSLPLDEHFRTLHNVMVTEGPTVIARYGESVDQCSSGCPGGEVLEVKVVLTAAWPYAHGPLRTIEAGATFTDGTIPNPTVVQPLEVTRTGKVVTVRESIAVVIKGDGTFCCADGGPISRLQGFGGTAVPTVGQVVKIDCDPIAMRLVIDQTVTPYGLTFESLGWQVTFGDPSMPCDCPVEIVEVRVITPEKPLGEVYNNGGPAIYPISLLWYAPGGGTWSATVSTLGGDSQGYPHPYPFAKYVVLGDGCVDECLAGTVKVRLTVGPGGASATEGTWTTDGTWTHYQQFFPSANVSYAIDRSNGVPIVTDPLTSTETVIVQVDPCIDTDLLRDPNTINLTAPAAPLFTSGTAAAATVDYLAIDAPASGIRRWQPSVPVVEINTGSAEMRGVDLRLWRNPTGGVTTGDFDQYNECSACTGWAIDYLPAKSVLRIDGRANMAFLVQANGAESSADGVIRTLPGMSRWPIFECAAVLLRAYATPGQYAADATVSLFMADREG